MGEQERESAGAARSQHVVLHGPADRRTMAAAMRPGIERSRDLTTAAAASPRCLVVVPTVEQGLVAADAARTLLGDDTLRVVPVSAVVRARRVLASGPVAVVVGTAADLLALRRDSALRMDDVQAFVMIALDEALAEGGAETLQALLADAPEGATRVASLDDDESEAVAAFLEAQLRRARHIGAPTPAEGTLPMTPSYAVTTAAGRADTLRAILDAIDPPSLVVLASSDASAESATAALRRIGVPPDGHGVQVVRQPTAQHVALIVLWDAPASAEALNEAIAARPVDAVALLLPDEVPAFRRLTGGAATPWTSPVRKESAEGRARATRAALVSALEQAGGASASELALLEPLLDRHDAVELAAAALRLFERAQRDAKRDAERFAERMRSAAAGARGAANAAGGAGARGALTVMTGGARPQRVFLGVGKRDGARVGDIVGAIANEANIPGERIGTVELFESHAIVELSADDATAAVTALESAMLRGRRLGARLDDRAGFGGRDRGDRGDRPERGARPSGPRGTREGRETRGAPRGDRPAPRGPRPEGRGPAREGARDSRDSGPRGPRPAPRGPRTDARGDAPSGPRGGGGRPPRGDEVKRAFGDRPAAERTEGRTEWSERASRMNNARRPVRPPATDRNDEE